MKEILGTMQNKKIIGLTGGIASGKSTVCKILKDMGAGAIDCDKLAHSVILKGTLAYTKIIDRISGDYLDKDGQIIRKKLGEIVFSNPDKLKVLEDITHKSVDLEIDKKIEAFNSDPDIKFIIIEAIKLIEAGLIKKTHELWIVTADKEQRIKRVMERDSSTYQDALNRINSQMSDEEMIKFATHVIDNSGDTESLEKQIKTFLAGGFSGNA